MERILLAVDFSYQLYRATASHAMLTSGDRFTGGIYGFLQSFGKMIRQTRASHVIFCRDSKPYRRSAIYPSYKMLRKKRQDDELLKKYQESEPYVLDLLRDTGLPLWSVAGFEADDLIAHCVSRHRNRWDRIVAASNDSDLYQLLWCRNFAIYRGEIRMVTQCTDLFGAPLSTEDYMLMSAIQGTHNDIEGIPGIGPITALKIIRTPGKLRELKAKHGALIERNLELIKLPHGDFPKAEAIPGRTEPFSARKLYRSAGAFDIDVTSNMLDAFEQVNR